MFFGQSIVWQVFKTLGGADCILCCGTVLWFSWGAEPSVAMCTKVSELYTANILTIHACGVQH